MPTRITCSFINPPKPGKTNGSIRVKSGEFYGVKPDMLSLFQAEQTYDIEFTSRPFNGQTYNTITSAKQVAAVPQQASNAGSSYGKYGNQDMATAERIFVCGALNAMIHGGHVEVSQVYISNVVNVLRASWAETFGAGPPKFDNPDMGENEGIPY